MAAGRSGVRPPDDDQLSEPRSLSLADPGAMQLASVSGPAIRGYREALRVFPAVRLVFAVGPHLRVWLEDGTRLPAFTQAVAKLSSALKVEALVPSLHDTVLRDLALREERDGAHAA